MQNHVTSFIPLIKVEDVDKSVEFYVNYLGFTIINDMVEDDQRVWAHVRNGHADLQLMKSSPDEIQECQNIVLYMRVETIKPLHKVLTEKGYNPTTPVEMPYGVDEFHVHDPDGYKIAYVSAVESDKDGLF